MTESCQFNDKNFMTDFFDIALIHQIKAISN